MLCEARVTYLLDDEDVKRWYDNLSAKSVLTATTNLRSLGLYCELNRIDTKALLEVAETKSFMDSFMDFVRPLEREGKAGLYISRFKKVLRS